MATIQTPAVARAATATTGTDSKGTRTNGDRQAATPKVSAAASKKKACETLLMNEKSQAT